MVRARALFCVIACGAGIGVEATALAATVHLRAPDECAEEDDIVAEVDSLIGRPLSEVPGMKFEVEIARGASGKFRLRLDTSEGAETRTRELAGNTCTELANVASVARQVDRHPGHRRGNGAHDPPIGTRALKELNLASRHGARASRIYVGGLWMGQGWGGRWRWCLAYR